MSVSLLLALYIIIPMPVAGGLPYLVGLTLLTAAIALRVHLVGNLIFPRRVFVLWMIALLMLGWEFVGGVLHHEISDLNYIASRAIWLLIGFGMVTLVLADGPDQVVRNVRNILLLSLTMLLIAMFMESMFYPRFDIGRQMGTINFGWPRATGVPQSDGKIGVYMSIAAVFFIIGSARTRDPLMYLGVGLAIAPILFTQSRSTMVALGASLAPVCAYLIITSSRPVTRAVGGMIGFVFLALVLANLDVIYNALQGEGKFAENAAARGDGNRYASLLLQDNFIFGVGAEAIHVDNFGFGVHNTFFALGIKNGIPGTLIFVAFLVFSASLAWSPHAGLIRNNLLLAALLGGSVSEHSLYPGLFNEHLWLIATTAIAISLMEHGYVGGFGLFGPRPVAAGRAMPYRSPVAASMRGAPRVRKSDFE